MADLHKNFAYSTIATAPSPASSGTSLVVQAGDGALFPTVPFNATIWPAGSQPTSTNSEIVRVTTIATDTFTITRAQESSSARTVVVGDQIANTITNKVLIDAEPGATLFFENIPLNGITRLNRATSYSKVPIFVPFTMRGSMSQMRSMEFYWERSAGTSLNLTGAVGIYSKNNSTQIGLISSESFAISITTSASWAGLRNYQVSLSSISGLSLSEGQYILGVYVNGSNDASAVMNLNFWGASASSNLVGSIFLGTNSTGATAATNHIVPFFGSLSITRATNTPFPSTVAITDVSGSGTADQQLLYFQIIA